MEDSGLGCLTEIVPGRVALFIMQASEHIFTICLVSNNVNEINTMFFCTNYEVVSSKHAAVQYLQAYLRNTCFVVLLCIQNQDMQPQYSHLYVTPSHCIERFETQDFPRIYGTDAYLATMFANWHQNPTLLNLAYAAPCLDVQPNLPVINYFAPIRPVVSRL